MEEHTNEYQENSQESIQQNESTKKGDGAQQLSFEDNRPEAIAQRKLKDNMKNAEGPLQMKTESGGGNDLQGGKANNTGMPDGLKAGIENLSGYSMDDVKVHYNSEKPAQLNALAYAQGTNIHIGPGQEEHLAHEAWHVVQQKEGRVAQTVQLKGGVAVNDDSGLEREADVMGGKALQMKTEEGDQSQDKLEVSKQTIGPDGELEDVTQLMTINFNYSEEDTYVSSMVKHVLEDYSSEDHNEELALEINHRKSRREGGYKPKKDEKNLLGGLKDGEVLNFVGHGSFSRTVGGYDPAQLVKLLKRLGLQDGQSGQIDLHGCLPAIETDAEGQKVVSYIEELQTTLQAEGYNFTVRGYEWCIHPGVDHYICDQYGSPPLEVSPEIYGNEWARFEKLYNKRYESSSDGAAAKECFNELMESGMVRYAELKSVPAKVSSGM